MLTDGEVLQNRYRILRKLGKGGMGLVYLATDMKMSDDVVIKQSIVGSVESLRQDKEYGKLTEEELQDVVKSSRQAFEREAKLLFGLRHNALPRVIAYDEAEQFLVMDYIPGKDLSELLNDRLQQKQGPFPLEQVLGWADQILDALHYLHTEFDQPIIHRDIKPANLKLSPKGHIFLLDFGLAKGARPGMATAQSILAGTKEYAPIEQLDEYENARQKTDPRSDLYSLAMTLHHLLSGHLPAETRSRVNAKARRWPDPLRPIHELAPAVPTAVSEVLQHAGAVHAEDRLVTAAEMRRLLRQTIVSPPPIILPPEEPESKTVVRPRKIVIPLNSGDEQSKPTAKVEKYFGFTDDLGNGVKFEMIYIPGGKFRMGAERWDSYSEKPPHEVTVPAFYIGKFPVTQPQWKAVMGDKLKPDFKGDDLAMGSVSWQDAKEFCQKLTQMTNKAYRLPSEAEWEYACRAGTTTVFEFGDSLSSDQEKQEYISKHGHSESFSVTIGSLNIFDFLVGRFEPNAFGLYDMFGLVREWCEDVWHYNYHKAPTDGSAWLTGGDSNYRVCRGGGGKTEKGGYYASRDWCQPDSPSSLFGFRVVVSARTQ